MSCRLSLDSSALKLISESESEESFPFSAITNFSTHRSRKPTFLLWKYYKMPTCTHTGRFISVPLCSGQSELASICLSVQLINQLDV